jgi:Chaperone of endosialidase
MHDQTQQYAALAQLMVSKSVLPRMVRLTIAVIVLTTYRPLCSASKRLEHFLVTAKYAISISKIGRLMEKGIQIQQATVRAPYHAPTLSRFGHVTVLTKSGSSGADENTTGNPSNPCTANVNRMVCAASDIRAKQNVVPLVASNGKCGVQLYAYQYLPRLHAQYGNGIYVGVMAQEVRQTYPDAVIEQDDGYLAVDYACLDSLLRANAGAQRSS